MKGRWLKVFLLSALGFAVLVDLVHGILNWIFHPLTGYWDNAMHLVLTVTPILYFVASIWGCFFLARYFRTTTIFRDNRVAGVVLLILVAGQLAFTLLAPARSGSSKYHPLFPDFLGGMLLALVTLIAGREHLRSGIGRILVVLTAFFWLAGSTTVDLLWLTERAERGVGPVWHLPVINSLLDGIAFSFIFGGRFAQMVLDFPETICKTGLVMQLFWFLALTLLLTSGLRWLTTNRFISNSAALASSIVFLGFKSVEWGSFIGD